MNHQELPYINISHNKQYCYKQYSDYVDVEKFRYALTAIASHGLSVEPGRWNKPNPVLLEDRTCFTCNDLEDEYHFVLACPLYDSLLEKYIPIYFRKYPCMFKFIDLCNSNNAQILRNLTLYCYNALELRNSISYI